MQAVGVIVLLQLYVHWQVLKLLYLQMAAVGLFKGRRLVSAGNRPDLDYFKVSSPTILQFPLHA